MCQIIHIDEVFEAILDDWDDPNDTPRARHLAGELPASPETPDDIHLEFVHAVRSAEIQKADDSAVQAVRDGLLTSG
jgi:hypothetical protein